MTLNKNKMKNFNNIVKKNRKTLLQRNNFFKVKDYFFKKTFFFFFIFFSWKDIGKENLLDCLSENLSIELEEINEKKGKIIF